MTDYYPHEHRKSILESCLFYAFKEAWLDQEKSIAEMMKNSSAVAKSTKEKFAYEMFNLKSSNQTFNISDSELFAKSVSLVQNVESVVKKAINTVESGSKLRAITFRRQSFRSGDFSVSQIGEKMSYMEAIKFLHSLYISSPDILYGALLYDGTRFINPLHPINAQSLVKNIEKEDSEGTKPTRDSMDLKRYKVMLYTYNNKENMIANKFLFDKNLEGVFTGQILNVLAMLQFESKEMMKITKWYSFSDMNGQSHERQYQAHGWKTFKFNYETVNKNANGESSNIYLQPVQLVNDGIATPYYGIVAEKDHPGTSGTRGYQLSPMHSCNVGATYVKIYTTGNVSVEAGSVCTGRYQNKSEDGKLSLNHANLGSPYFRDILGYGSMTFADLCVKVSLGIYADAFGMEKISISVEEENNVISFEEYKKINKNAKLKDYLLKIKG